ncbi:hypothetical protein [Ancylobacter pratisalsi]|uniref:Uncharacterized protein n=1 Tax=Ancylobacter pratisalsi TaxID=1745854 RepID=A0A6P1YH29_9HYPH|nr:hypothetical protein [Ancylobacter pratisalsi]QIB32260.1 hypothetical protein G3A50_14460 [Ancylobacter pratisalsi]
MEKRALSRFVGAEAWGFLAPEQQATIGALAMELVLAWSLDDEAAGLTDRDEVDTRIERVARAFGDHVIIDRLTEEVLSPLPPEVLSDETDNPRIPLAFGQICRACGCSQNDGCDVGCCWAEDDLCSACADLSPPPRSVYVHADAAGVIRFLSMPPVDNMLLFSGPDSAVREIVAVEARHAYDGATLLVPGLPEAEDSLQRLDALCAFQTRLERAWAARESEVLS